MHSAVYNNPYNMWNEFPPTPTPKKVEFILGHQAVGNKNWKVFFSLLHSTKLASERVKKVSGSAGGHDSEG